MGNQNIKCNVTNCHYNDKAKHCTLDNIIVGSDAGGSQARENKDTACLSFQA